MDSRDFRKKWLQLQESWTEEADVNVNATKAEKLDEKRKLPDALKAHQFGKKNEKEADEKKDDKKNPEKDKKEDTKNEKKDDKKPSFLKKKATEGKKPAVKGWTHAHAKQRVADAEKKKREAEKAKKVKEDASVGGATTSAAVGGAKGVCPDAHVGAPERLQKRKMPEKVVTAKESKLFSHFKKYMAEAGLPLAPEVEPEAGLEAPVNDVAAGAVDELTGEAPPVDPALDAPADDAASVLADIQARFPGKKIHICVEADPTEPFSAEDVAAAEAAIAAVPEDAGLEGDEGAEEMLEPEAGAELPVDQDIEDEVKTEAVGGVSVNPGDKYQYKTGGVWTVRNAAGSRGIVMIDPEGNHLLVTNKQLADLFTPVANESCSMREDEEEDMGAADGVEEIPTGDEMGAEAGEGGEELGAELDTEAGSEASPEMISLTPEQWTEFLAGAGDEEGLGDELAGATDVADAGEGDDSDSESNKSPDTLG